MQRVILNFQRLPSLDALGLRKILAACIRPQRSLIFGANDQMVHFLEDAYLPNNMRICSSEKEVAEDFGPFLLEKEKSREIPASENIPIQETIGYKMERRRGKRMHVAIPLELGIFPEGGKAIKTQAIATNISEGGFFAEYLDLDVAQKLENMDHLEGLKAEIQIFPSSNFPDEYHITGRIKRKDLRKKQLGLGVEFVES